MESRRSRPKGSDGRRHASNGFFDRCIFFASVLIAAILIGPLTGCGSGQSGSTGANADSGTVANADPVEFDLASYAATGSDGTTVIHVPAGTYKVAATLSLSSDTILEGEGDTTILEPDTSFAGSQFITNADVGSGNKNIIVRNLKIVFPLPQLSGSAPGILHFDNVEHLEIDNVTMVNDSPMYGVDLSAHVSRATVQGCTFTNTNKVSGGGVMIRNGDPVSEKITSDIVVRNNSMESVSDEVVSVFAWQGRLENVRIENNTIKASGASFGIAAYGINSPEQSGRLTGVEITGNSIEGGRVGGIGVFGGAQQVDVVDNQISKTMADGIFLYPGGDGLPAVRNVMVSRNTISNAGRDGVYADGVDVQVLENVITNCSKSGVYAAAGVSVIGNTITGGKYLILAEVENDVMIHDNIFPKGGDVLYLH